RLLQLLLPREHLFPHPYQAGTLLFPRDAPPSVLRYLRSATFPLLAPDTTYRDDWIRQSAERALNKQKVTFASLRIGKPPHPLFFKHEERPVLIQRRRLVMGRPTRDELNAGQLKLNVAFTLQPGSYATLVVRRLFHFCYREDTGREEPTSREDGRRGAGDSIS